MLQQSIEQNQYLIIVLNKKYFGQPLSGQKMLWK